MSVPDPNRKTSFTDPNRKRCTLHLQQEGGRKIHFTTLAKGRFYPCQATAPAKEANCVF